MYVQQDERFIRGLSVQGLPISHPVPYKTPSRQKRGHQVPHTASRSWGGSIVLAVNHIHSFRFTSPVAVVWVHEFSRLSGQFL